MKLNKTFKKSISLILTIIMIFSTMVVGMVTVGAAVTKWYIVGYQEGNSTMSWEISKCPTISGATGSYTLNLNGKTGKIYFKLVAEEGTNKYLCTGNQTLSNGVKSNGLSWYIGASGNEFYKWTNFSGATLNDNTKSELVFDPSSNAESVTFNISTSNYVNYVTVTEKTPTPTSAPIPSGVVGATEANAKTLLNNAGFNNITVKTAYSNSVAKGNVISVSPGEGTDTAFTATVTITVSLGPETTEPPTTEPTTSPADKVAVPDVEGDNVDVASKEITDAGLKVNAVYEYNDTVEENVVIKVSPSTGTLLDKESLVTIYVSLGKKPATEPTIPSGTKLENVKIYFKGTNLKSLTPTMTINDGTNDLPCTLAKDSYIGTYINGSYRFYWYTAIIPEVYVGTAYNVTIKTSGSSMNAVGTIDFSTCNDKNEIYLAVDNMQTGVAFEDITNNETAKLCFRSSANMITNVTNQFDPNKALAKAMLTLLNADGTTTTAKYSIGDTNADGTVNIKDATVAQMMSANIVAENSTNSILGDYDVSGDVNVKDATGIQTYIVNC